MHIRLNSTLVNETRVANQHKVPRQTQMYCGDLTHNLLQGSFLQRLLN